jgi:hypothetical protein
MATQTGNDNRAKAEGQLGLLIDGESCQWKLLPLCVLGWCMHRRW